jgi:hypothetical protein
MLSACLARRFSLHSSAMRKVLLPLALFLGAIVLLTASAYWYEQKYGSDGSFPSDRHH